MADTGRRVIFYDQLGCGRSSIPESKPEMWTVDLYVDELNALREALALGRIHLLGQSWGGMLGMEYALTQPRGLESLTLASSPASMIQWVEEANRLREDLPPDVQQTLLHHESAGTFDSPEYKAAMDVFYAQHVCRVDPVPEYVRRTFDAIDRNREVYLTMNGPSEFHVIGTLKSWDIIPRLGEIRVPTLVTSGRYDEATPLIAGTVREGIPDARWVIFEENSHMPHTEEAGALYAGVGRVPLGGRVQCRHALVGEDARWPRINAHPPGYRPRERSSLPCTDCRRRSRGTPARRWRWDQRRELPPDRRRSAARR